MTLRKPRKSTLRRAAASRENGKKSHGPVSAQGKANMITAAQRDARLAPTDQRWTWVQRQGNGLLCAINRSVKTVIRLAQLYPPLDRPKSTLGTPGGDTGYRDGETNNPDGRASKGEGNGEASAPPKEPRVLSSQRSHQV